MSITLSSIILIALILFPGIVFKRFYFSNTFSTQFRKGLFADRIITTLFWGTVIQLLSLWSYLRINEASFDIKDPLAAIKVIGSDFDFINLIENENYIFPFAFYIFWCCLLAMLSGFTAHKLVRTFKVDQVLSAAKYSNTWHYLFTSEISTWNRKRRKTKNKFIRAEIDVSIGNSLDDSKFFSGTLYNYTIDENTGKLENLFLVDASRYSKTGKEFKKFESDIFLLEAKSIIDLNIRYIEEESVVRRLRRKQIISKIKSLGSLIILIFCVVFPFLFSGTDTPMYRSFISVILYLLGAAFVLASLSKAQEKSKELSSGVKIVIFIIGLLLITAANISIKLFPFQLLFG